MSKRLKYLNQDYYITKADMLVLVYAKKNVTLACITYFTRLSNKIDKMVVYLLG